MDAAEHADARAKELTMLNASAKGFRTSFAGSRKTLTQAFSLYLDGPTASRRRTIDEALSKIGPQAEKVHNTYQKLIEPDDNEAHLDLLDARQQTNENELNQIRQQADEVLGEETDRKYPVISNRNSSKATSKTTSSRQRWLL
jgi:Fe-S cluster assembly scaffold protein SufB